MAWIGTIIWHFILGVLYISSPIWLGIITGLLYSCCSSEDYSVSKILYNVILYGLFFIFTDAFIYYKLGNSFLINFSSTEPIIYELYLTMKNDVWVIIVAVVVFFLSFIFAVFGGDSNPSRVDSSSGGQYDSLIAQGIHDCAHHMNIHMRHK